MNAEDVSAGLTQFIRERFLDGDPRGELEETTPLLQWGLLNSLNTAILLGFIRDTFGVLVPPALVTGQNFRDVASITRLVTAQRQDLPSHA